MNKILNTMYFVLAVFLLSNCTTTQNVTNKSTDDVVEEVKTAVTEKAPVVKSPVKAAMYVGSNKPGTNTVYAYVQRADGSIDEIGEYASGGSGTGNVEIFDWGYDVTHPLKDGVDPFISTYAINQILGGKFVLVVNAGSGSISSFKVNADHSLTLVSTAKAGNIHPSTIATHGNMIYVASVGEFSDPPFQGNLKGLTISPTGHLTEMEGSIRNLNARPSCVQFTPDGKYIVVNELVTGHVKVYGVEANGLLSAEPLSMATCPNDRSAERWLAIPVGFDIVPQGDEYIVLVSEARFLDKKGSLRMVDPVEVVQSPLYGWQTGSTSSFVVDANGKIELKSGDVMTGTAEEGGEIANCWVEASSDGKKLYAANALSSSLTEYDISADGTLVASDITAYKLADESEFYADLVFSQSDKYLNILVGNKGQILVLKQNAAGKLTRLGTYGNMNKVGTFGMCIIE